MARWFQFQSKAEPLPVPPVFEDSWHQPWSEPVRQKIPSRLVIALIASGAFQTFVPSDVVTAAVTPTATTDSVIFPRSIIYQAKAEPLPVPEIITVDKWFEPLSDPVRLNRLATAQQQFLVWSGYTPAAAVTTAVFNSTDTSQVVFPRSVIYQSQVLPPQVPEVIYENKWHQSWSEPVRIKRTVTQQQFLAWSGSTPAAVIDQPWAQPARVKKPVTQQQFLAWSGQTPEVIYENKWHQPWSEPTRTKKAVAQQQFLAWSGYTPSAEVITEDKWHQAWSQPVRVKPKVCFQQDLAWSGYTPSVAVVTAVEPTSVTSQVTFPRSIIYQSKAWCPQPIAAAAVSYFPYVQGDTGLSFQKTIIYQASAEAPTTQIYWNQPWSEPVRRKNYSTALAQTVGQTSYVPVAAVTAVEPTTLASAITFPRSVIYQSVAWTPQIITPDVTTEGKWHQPWSEPVRFKKSLPVREQQTLAWCPQTITPEVITEGKWHYAWSEPVRTRKLATAQQRAYFAPEATIPAATAIQPTTVTSSVTFPRSIQYQSLAWAPKVIIPEVITEGKWHQGWSEPVRFKKGLPVREQQTLAWCPQTITPPAVTPYFPYVQGDTGLRFQKTIIYQVSAEAESPERAVWYQPWSEPVRFKSGLPVREQQTLAWCPQIIIPEVITEGKWHYAWSEPVRIRRLATAQQRAHFAPEATIPAVVTAIEPTTVTSPVSFPRSIIYQSFAWPNYIEVRTEDKWHQPWSEPVRFRRLPVAQQQFLAWSGHTPAPAPITLVETSASYVFAPLTIIYQSVAWTPYPVAPETITEDKWHQAWSIPVKLKYQFRTDLQQAVAEPPAYPNIIRTIGWYAPLSEPVRQKVGLATRLQESFGTPPSYPILLRTIGWHAPFNEPVRQKKGLWTSLQQFLAFGAKPVPPANVGIILDATEVNRDVASIYAVVYNRAVRVYVSIKEVPGSDPTYASIEETD